MAKYKLLLFIALFSFLSSFGQLTPMTAFQYGFKRIVVDSTLQIPSFCGVPTLRNSTVKNGALAMDTCANKLYKYTRSAGWSEVSGGGGGGSQDLQSVTDEGNTTNNQMIVGDGTDSLILSKDAITLFSGTYGGYGSVISALVNSWTYSSNSTSLAPILNGQHNFYLYNSNTSTLTTDTLATLANVRASGSAIDTTGAFLISVSQPNDSTLTFQKGAISTSYTIRSSIAGSATRLVTTVYNNSGSTITKGSVVYINGRHSSNLPTIALAQANTEANSYATFALVETDITNGSSGIVIQAGNIGNLNLPTSSYTDGQVVFLSPTVAGGITTTKPLAPYHIVKIGTITRAHPTFGTIELKIENGWQMDELSDVQIPAVPNDSTLLQFSRVDSLWHAVSITNAIGSNYIKPSDTSTLQRKNVAAYTFKANNTNAAANMTDQGFRDTSGVYSSTITWTGTTAPSGTTNHTYRMTRVGKQVTVNIHLNYGTAGSALTSVQMALPAEFPTPAEPTSLGAGSEMLYPAYGYINTANTTPSSTPRASLRVNPGDTGYELYIVGSSGNYKTAWITVTYWTN